MIPASILFLVVLSFISSSWGDTIKVNTTSDGYLYLGAPTTVNSTGYYLDVGLYGTPGNHYSIAYAKFDTDLSFLEGAQKIYLALNLRNFVAPVFGNGPTAQYTRLDYPTSGGYFTLKAVPLTSSFPESGVNATWVRDNLISPTAAGTVVLQNSGYYYMDITSAVNNWIANPTSERVLGFVGIGSTPNTWSLNLGTKENNQDLDGTILSAATPMYLFAPPAPVAQSCSVSGNQLVMIFETVPNISYTLKTKSNLSDRDWVTVDSPFVAGPTSTTTLTVPMTDSPGRGFYRLEITQ